MPAVNFFPLSSENEAPALVPTSLGQPSKYEQLQCGTTAFTTGLAAVKNKENLAEQYQEKDPKSHFLEAVQYFKQSIVDEVDLRILALAYGYLTLIRFDGLDGVEKQQNITPDMLKACKAINTLAETQGLADISQDFQTAFLAMIERLYELYYHYGDKETWCARLIKQVREYRLEQEGIVGKANSYSLANEYSKKITSDIDTVKETFTLLKLCAPVSEITDSATETPSAPSPVR